MASQPVVFKGAKLIHILTHISDDLPKHVKGEAYWVSYENHEKSTYHFVNDQGIERPVELINHNWHYLEWKDSLY
jgi:hypothetical protein